MDEPGLTKVNMPLWPAEWSRRFEFDPTIGKVIPPAAFRFVSIHCVALFAF